MAAASGGPIRPYGVAIHDALADPKTSTEYLVQLRDSARKLLDEQGDLEGAAKALEAEIARRSGGRHY